MRRKRDRSAGSGHPPPKMSASAGVWRACCLDREDRGAAPTEAATRGAHRPQAAGPLFIFRAAGPGPTGSTAAARTHRGRHRHAPVSRGSRDAAPLPPHACGSGGTATFLMARRIVGRTPDRVPSAAAVYLCPRQDHGARTVGWQLLADTDFRNGVP